MKIQKIMDEQWDTLIVLDACRFDYFQKVYKKYLNGRLEKRISKGSHTGEWLVNNFHDRYNVTYISASPLINSKGIPLRECISQLRYSWKATDHFSNIIDVWEFGWDKNIGTVPPEIVNKAFFSNKDENRTIVHYMQPHAPYLAFKTKGGQPWIHKRGEKRKSGKIFSAMRKWATRNRSGLKVALLVGKENLWRAKKWFGIEATGFYEHTWRIVGTEGIKKLYEENLRRVLKKVAELIEELEGTVIITSDHGEAFGEEGVWAHIDGVHIRPLLEVPWLKIKK